MRVCAVIPAAGTGSRLGFGCSKLLVPVYKTRTVWSILQEKLSGLVDEIHVVMSSRDVDTFYSILDKNPPDTPVTVSVQPSPTGTGPAIFNGYQAWSKADMLLVIWGDQVGISRETVNTAIALHGNRERQITIPLVQSTAPYVEYLFDTTERLTEIRQSREGDVCNAHGWADVGVFLLSTRGLRNEWGVYNAPWYNRSYGTLTKEINFLSFLVFLANRNWNINRFSVSDSVEARGINTKEDLEFYKNIYKGVLP